jgi:hypothetical protein
MFGMRQNALENHLDGLFDQAVNKAGISIAGVTRQAALENRLGSSRLAFAYVEAIKVEGEAFIGLMLPIYEVSKSTVFNRKVKSKFLKCLDKYTSEARTWIQDPVGFPGGLRAVFESNFDPMIVGLKKMLEREMDRIDSLPSEPWWKRHPIGLLLAILALALSAAQFLYDRGIIK